MAMTFDSIRDAVLLLPKGDQVRILTLVALEVSDAHPGIDFQDNICGGSARIIRTRIPVWLLEHARTLGASEAKLLRDYPTLTAQDLVNAWAYARANRAEIGTAIAANETD